MALPVGHAAAGYLAYEAVRPAGRHRAGWLATALLLANAPDLDYLPGLLVGHPDAWHRGVTHSLAAALAVAAGVTALAAARRLPGRLALGAALAWASRFSRRGAPGPSSRPIRCSARSWSTPRGPRRSSAASSGPAARGSGSNRRRCSSVRWPPCTRPGRWPRCEPRRSAKWRATTGEPGRAVGGRLRRAPGRALRPRADGGYAAPRARRARAARARLARARAPRPRLCRARRGAARGGPGG